mmetsp:Transcript_38949/g.72439  ORF Transcript_38949/g.72439 Transcript_38949/m.72439 type:complete len:203 (-) Transcript_38949:249-857(-)
MRFRLHRHALYLATAQCGWRKARHRLVLYFISYKSRCVACGAPIIIQALMVFRTGALNRPSLCKASSAHRMGCLVARAFPYFHSFSHPLMACVSAYPFLFPRTLPACTTCGFTLRRKVAISPPMFTTLCGQARLRRAPRSGPCYTWIPRRTRWVQNWSMQGHTFPAHQGPGSSTRQQIPASRTTCRILCAKRGLWQLPTDVP